MKFPKLVFLALMLLAGVFGCKQADELDGIGIESGDAEFAVPLLKARTSIEDILENFDDYTFVEITPDSVIHLRYKGDVLSQNADEFFQAIYTSLPPVIPLDTNYFTLSFDTVETQLKVDYARYSSGTVNAGIYSDYEGLVDFTLILHEATKNGQPLTIHRQFMSPVGITFGGVKIPTTDPADAVPVEGYELRPVNDEIHISYVALKANGDTLHLAPNEVALNNTNVKFSYIEGYLGNFKNKGVRDSINIEFFENWIQGDVFFEDPIIQIHIENSFGMPTRSSIEIFDIITADGQRIPLESEFISETGIDFEYPTIAEAGQSKNMTFTFDANNSNIEDVLGSRPIGLDYKVDAIANPDSVTDQRGFITDSSFYRVQVEVDLPLHGRASGFGAIDTFDLDFSDFNEVQAVEFKMVADNNMPLGISTQAYFIGENGAVLDSLFNGIGYPIEAAPVNGSGIVTGQQTTTTLIDFDAARFDNIRNAKKLALHAFFSTSNQGQQSVKAFANQEVEIRMGLKVKI
ncbi:MAG: hypothetical protein MUC59_13425 [Saprospiraceae bacterium]|nr:hypothetical protein [Saprospiraceae bacterium]